MIKMNLLKRSFLVLMVLNTIPAFASHEAKALSKMLDSSPTNYFATITLAPEWQRNGSASTITLFPPFSNHYTVDDSWTSEGVLGLAAGLERAWNEQFAYQLGVAGYFHTANEISGHVWQFALPDFDNFIYHYHVQSNQLMVTGKLLSTVRQTLHPYIAAEIGAGFNQASAYNEIPIIFEALPMLPFRDHTKTTFSYGVGVGIDVDINPHLRLGMGYQFSDLGKVALGRSPLQLTQETLNFSHCYSHQLRMQLTALI